MPLEPVDRRPSAVDVCARQLRSVLLSAEYREGERLPPERKLAQTLRVNRVTVRGALSRLVAEGLLSVRQGSGYAVRGLFEAAGASLIPALSEHLEPRRRVEVVSDLLEVRRALAGVVLQKLAERRPSRAQLATIASAIAQLEADLGGPAIELVQRELEVLGAVVAATQSPVLKLVLNPIFEVLQNVPGLVAAMYRDPTRNLWGWKALVQWLRDGEGGPEQMLELLHELDQETVRAWARSNPGART